MNGAIFYLEINQTSPKQVDAIVKIILYLLCTLILRAVLKYNLLLLTIRYLALED